MTGRLTRPLAEPLAANPGPYLMSSKNGSRGPGQHATIAQTAPAQQPISGAHNDREEQRWHRAGLFGDHEQFAYKSQVSEATRRIRLVNLDNLGAR